MKNFSISFLLVTTCLVTSLLTAGCGNELDERNLGESPSSFTASIEQEGATKTLMGVKYTSGSTTYRPVEWATGDQIAISGASANYTAGTPTNNSRTATFTGSGAQMEGGLYKAYYPATIYNKTTKKTSFPATQTYGGLSGSKTVIGDLPMYAASSTTSLTFRNLCAVLNFKLKGESTQKVTAIEVSSSNQNLWGEFTIGGTAESPTVTMNTATGGRAVTLNCGAGVALSPTDEKDFFIAIPAQTYDAGTLTIQIKDGTTLLATLTNSSATADQTTFSRNQIYEIGKNMNVTAPFTVLYNGAATSSSGTLVEAAPIDIDSLARTLNFTVRTTMGFTATIEAVATEEVASITANSEAAPDAGGNDVVTAVRANKNNSQGTISIASNFTEKAFSIDAEGNTVFFSPGNLQYRGSTGSWRFASHQWDFVGDAVAGTVYEGSAKSDNRSISQSYAGWIDLFGWGTSGKTDWYGDSNLPGYYYLLSRTPWSTETNNTERYGPKNGFGLEGIYADGDWGVYNAAALNDASGKLYRWNTPSLQDWNYLFNGRSTSYRYLMAALNMGGARKFKVTFRAKAPNENYAVSYEVVQSAAPIFGVILFPDNFTATGLVSAYSGHINAATISPMSDLPRISAAVWESLEKAGCVFLPEAGRRSGTTISDANSGYWSTDIPNIQSNSGLNAWSNGQVGSFRLNIPTGYGIAISDPDSGPFLGRSNGLSVRLIGENKLPPVTPGNGRFSVAPNRKVNFTTSNVMYAGSKSVKKWRLMEYPWSTVESNGTVSLSANSDIGLFGWTTSGRTTPPWTTSYQATYSYLYDNPYGSGDPEMTNPRPDNYFYLDFVEQYRPTVNTEFDWGWQPESSSSDWAWSSLIYTYNGRIGIPRLRTLTAKEWYYLTGCVDNVSPTGTGTTYNWRVRTMGNTATPRYVLAKVNGVNGMIIFPDDYNTAGNPHPAGIAAPVKRSAATAERFNDNVYTAEQFMKMGFRGAVFLPAAGIRTLNASQTATTNVTSVGTHVNYWSASAGGANVAWGICAYDGHGAAGSYPQLAPVSEVRRKEYGLAVRLVQEMSFWP